jgi:hypothetical protein
MIGVKINVKEMINKCKSEFLNHHPEYEEKPISNNKIIYEMAKYYLEN